MRKQFTFYSSFFEAVSVIKDPDAKLQAYDAICAYALTGEEPDLESLADAAAIAFIMAKPNLDSSKQKAEAGRRGGNASTSEAEPKQSEAEAKQTASKKESENEGEKEREYKNECYTPPTPSVSDYGFSPELESAVTDWLTYKQERREAYKPTGLKSMLTQVKNAAAEYGDAAVIDIIRDSMASGYQGIVFDRLKRGVNAGGAGRNTGESPKPKRNWGIKPDV